MKEILKAMEAIAPQLQALETQLVHGQVDGKDADELLDQNPQLAFSRLVEFKAMLDRMRGLTWVYMEAAATAGRLPARGIPQALKQFLQQQAAKPHPTDANDRKTR